MTDSKSALAPPGKIVDAHHHLWNPASRDPDIGYVWLGKIGAPKPFGDPTAIQRDYLLDEFLCEQSVRPLAASVHVQADGAIPEPRLETHFVQRMSNAGNFPIAIVGCVDLSREDAGDVLQSHMPSANFRGVRQILSRLDFRPDISFASKHYIRDSHWRKAFGLLAEHGLSFDLQLYPEQMEEAAEFLRDFPDIPIIVDHAGSPYDQSRSGLEIWRANIEKLASLSNVNVKLCGFGMYDRVWTARSIKPITDTLLDLFGADRLMFASNFPVDKLMRTYAELLTDLIANLSHLSADDFSAIFHDNARRVYRI